MKRYLFLCVALLLFSSSVFATSIVGGCAGISNVAVTLAGDNFCSLGPLLFGNFTVNSADFPLATVSIGSSTTGVSGNEVNLGFRIFGVGSLGDVLMMYQVIGTVLGVDLSYQAGAIPGGFGVTIQETVCDQPFNADATCPGTTLALFGSPSPPRFDGSVSFDATNGVFIKKDIQFNGGTLSDFVNSQEIVPEPATIVLIGAGLLGLGLVRRRYAR